jgi:hypothetical protein
MKRIALTLVAILAVFAMSSPAYAIFGRSVSVSKQVVVNRGAVRSANVVVQRNVVVAQPYYQQAIVQRVVAAPVYQQQIVQRVYAQPVVQQVYAQPVIAAPVVQQYSACGSQQLQQGYSQQLNSCGQFFSR